ncbi:MAG: hypothetical protein CM1200mP10_28280 [Candidatus Neomarinimicrobiota bacterium]|nr:MAG: hypothetical protein CM1200mP10_28280 [Candidatus Neomarinimicrobiota bacterium]
MKLLIFTNVILLILLELMLLLMMRLIVGTSPRACHGGLRFSLHIAESDR